MEKISELMPCPFCGNKYPRAITTNDAYTWCTNPSCAIYDLEIKAENWQNRALNEKELILALYEKIDKLKALVKMARDEYIQENAEEDIDCVTPYDIYD